ncbi:3-dehydroquinate synthase [Lachnospiraceae bacterium AM23-2LB]|nr:3-dehydroquinate synthase [Lachnospiraceae bacterium AM23-2LB]RJW00981.1 3-dehydroquinate synthase [Lachnospiraceae bacterium AM40-2BH]
MIIKSKFKNYEVAIEENLFFLSSLIKLENTQYVIDKNVFDLYSDYFQEIPKNRLMIIEALEEHKIIDTALDICEKMTEIPAKRNATLVSIGGGIIQDLTGFVANILYRGIHWIFVPTTLLASCDSCIGGKTSLNYKKYKNLLGTFYPPDKIYICAKFFETLSERDYKSGLGEVVKFNIMAGLEGLENIAANITALLERESNTVNIFVKNSLNFKKKFIEIDEFDKGERIKLNFAHTFGHAIEVVTNYEIPHGTAVAIGMIMANSVSLKRRLISEEIVRKSESVLLKVIDIDPNLLNVPVENVIDAMRKDKKQVGNNLTVVLIAENSDNSLDLIIKHDLDKQEVVDAFQYFLSLS